MGRPRECFRNAATLALRKPDLYVYVEGYAVNRWVAMHTVAHAWCVGSDNFVVDRTWDEGTEYFGVPFRHDYLRRVLKVEEGLRSDRQSRDGLSAGDRCTPSGPSRHQLA
jgi:hypothetical protein